MIDVWLYQMVTEFLLIKVIKQAFICETEIKYNKNNSSAQATNALIGLMVDYKVQEPVHDEISIINDENII